MKILLIHPQNYLQRFSSGIYGRSLRYAPLTMPTLKALIPQELNAEVRIIDEMVENIDFTLSADLVAITCITGTALRAYEIAKKFRDKGSTVVLGGIHPTLQTEESLEHGDAVVCGYAERSWPALLRDFTKGEMKRVYEDLEPFSPSLIQAPDRTGIKRKDYIGWCTVEMSRGCSNSCDFCISHRFHHSYICREVADVIDEIKSMSSKLIFFLDPNLIGNREHAKLFFTELKKLKKWWVGCATLDVVDDPELLELMAKSGCKGLLMGFESFCQDTLHSTGKTKNLGKNYTEVVRTLHDYGISVQACFVFGFDSDTPSIFEETAEMIVQAKFDLPQISIYTPFPGTPLFEQFEREDRIVTRNWSLYNGQNVVFNPAQMSIKELEDGTDYVRRRVYSWSALSQRFFEKPAWVKPLVAMSYLGFRFYQYRIKRLGTQEFAG
ncbi:MAG: B12-binding domain-containing radical SAM protein [Desulfobulbaceae bacterium]|nr:B12-binding domain-containing radical SAM protein [Desulfobulbaceae bacterium]